MCSQVSAECTSGYDGVETFFFISWMMMSRYYSRHPSSLPHLRLPSSFPFVCFFSPLAAAFVTCPFFHLSSLFPSFSVIALWLNPSHLSQGFHPPKKHPSPHVLLSILTTDISITPLPPHTLSLSLSLVSPCCGLCLLSLSELLSQLSAPSARTKSSSAHDTTKDTREIKGASAKRKRGSK